jgi:hypothetical protein
MAMTPRRFEVLLNGPLHHPISPLRLTRLALALFAVVEATGDAGERALEAYCAARQDRDEHSDDCAYCPPRVGCGQEGME